MVFPGIHCVPLSNLSQIGSGRQVSTPRSTNPVLQKSFSLRGALPTAYPACQPRGGPFPPIPLPSFFWPRGCGRTRPFPPTGIPAITPPPPSAVATPTLRTKASFTSVGTCFTSGRATHLARLKTTGTARSVCAVSSSSAIPRSFM